MVSWRPQLREMATDIGQSWEDAAARSVEAVQNSGFITRVMEVASGSVVGPGLRVSARPDYEALGWKADYAREWASKAESGFRAWAEDPVECDAAGKMTFHQMQQAWFASYMAFGETLALLPLIKRMKSTTATKVALVPPMRLINKTEKHNKIVNGVRTDKWGFPLGYWFRDSDPVFGYRDYELVARDRDGRPNVLHSFDPAIATNRGISPLAPVLKVVRQVDQYADATLTAALIQTIFAATIKSNVTGLGAFDGMLTDKDRGELDIQQFLQSKGEFYDGAKMDLTQHGRIAHLFPNDELEFVEAKQPGQQYDHFMGWLMREIAAGAGVTYENATGDYRGATYSSVRMAGATEWLTVLRRRANIIVPNCRAVYSAWMEEAIATGELDFPGGIRAFYAKRAYATRTTWTGPARPQADEFKAARSHEVLKDMGATTLSDIAEDYGRDIDDIMAQQAAENDMAEKHGLPLPWSPKDILETREGQDLELNAPAETPDPNDRKNRKGIKKPQRKGGGRTPGESEPKNAQVSSEVENGD